MDLQNINSVKNAQLKDSLAKYDADGDGKVGKQELAKALQDGLAGKDEYGGYILDSKSRAELQQINDAYDESNPFSKWWNDKDKISTDGDDDGKISVGEKAKSFGKGFAGGIVKTAVKHPIMTGALVAGGAAAVFTTLGAASVIEVLVGLGIAAGMSMSLVLGVLRTVMARTDGETKDAWESIGHGAAMSVASVAGAVAGVGMLGWSMLKVTEDELGKEAKDARGLAGDGASAAAD